MGPHAVTLAHATDWAGFRQAARQLVQAGVPPQQVEWFTPQDAAQDLFASPTAAPPAPAAPASTGTPPDPASLPPRTGHPAPRVPEDFVRLCERLVLHRNPARFALMYRLLWRLAHDRALRHDPLDADRMQAHHMVRAVARDMHKMHAFVRFRPVTDSDGHTVQVAWFEPDHFITEANAGFFVRRFTQMHWAILTPDASVRWDGTDLHVGPGGQRSDAPPPDAGEALWLTYYRHIFNPARLKTTMMKKEMPTRYWRNLPEAALITELAHGAHERSGHMVEAEATTPRKRIEPMRRGASSA
ncbi:TIGR03915 family putative DNA repair protein [Acidovorax sp. LjRoot194]|uniref:TIGR03915 family putative DNA repair protein n=1 Tax=Acidovorax sp. LjRoot194 TaxID=3342280 RepID=UPI003ECFBA90